MKTFKCFHCKEKVEEDIAVRYVHETAKTKNNRFFHPECYGTFTNNKKEKIQLDEICEYVKVEIFKLEKEKLVPPYFVNRLLGLRSGNFSLKAGVKVFGESNSYPFDVIFNTIKIQKVNIINGIYNEAKFKNDKHKIDYIFVIITNNINDVYSRMKQKKESDERIKDIDLKENREVEFKNKTNIKENKVASKLKHLF